MLSLTIALLLSQTPPAVSPELVKRYETERGPLLEALAAQFACKKPKRSPEPLCDAALVEVLGTAPDISGQNAMIGITYRVKRGKRGKLDVGVPWLSAMAVNKDSVGVWGSLTDLTPQDATERKQLTKLAKDYEALFRGRKAAVKTPAHIRELVSVWSRTANQLVEKQGTAWVFKGSVGGLRQVGERWVMIGVPKEGEGILVSVFTPG
jgi:hypothetical protein